MFSFINKSQNIFFLNNYSVLLILCIVTLARIVALFFSPIELSVDEAQYWHWSRSIEWGYFTKPPIIAWIIALSTSVFGQEEWAVRLCSPIIHFLISILLWITSYSMLNSKSGQVAALIWIFTPIASLGSFIISTDTPLLLFWSIALFFSIKLIKTRTLSYSIAIGVTIGFGLLSKYAALYFLIFLVLWWIIYDRGKYLKIKSLILITIFTFIVSSGNLYWNYENDFVTFNHTMSNADLKNIIFNYKNIFEFLFSQLLVFGPILFLLYLYFVFHSFYINDKLSLLAMLSFPIVFVMLIQSFLKIANANWAITAYIAATLIISAFIVVNKKKYLRFFFKIGMFLNIFISLFILSVTITGSFKPLELKSNPLRKNLGFEQHAKKIKKIVIANSISSIVFENRSDITRFNYYINRFENKLENNIYLNTSATIPGNFYEANFDFKKGNFDVNNKILIVSKFKEVKIFKNLSNINFIEKITEKTIDGLKREYYLFIGTIVK